MMTTVKSVSLLISAIVLLSTCKKESQSDVDEELIKQYITEQGLDATRHNSGLYYVITKSGNGSTFPGIYSNVEVRYKGYLTDGSVFDQTSGDETRTFNLSGLISGWQYGIPLLRKDGEGIFIVPSQLGYGGNARTGIPANSVLVFEIELVDFSN